MKMNKTNNKMVAMLMVLVLALTLIGCGENKEPVTNGDVVENTESTESNTETVTSEEATTETESKDIVDGKVPNGDKPAEPTVSPTEKPAEPSETEKPAEPSPEPTEKPQTTPEPTPTPHVHEYAESITVQPSCAVAGEKKLTCSCGDVKTEAIPATGNHNWVTQYTQIEHESVGHVVTTEQQVQVGTTRRTEYECAYCGHREDSPDALQSHRESYVAEGNKDHVFARTLAWDYDEPVYETQTVSEWIIDVPSWIEQVPCGEKCASCNAIR